MKASFVANPGVGDSVFLPMCSGEPAGSLRETLRVFVLLGTRASVSREPGVNELGSAYVVLTRVKAFLVYKASLAL